MSVSSFELIRSPGTVAWVIFWAYLFVFVYGVYYVLETFQRENILFGHVSNIFNFLTKVRIWSHTHRIAYSFLVTSGLVGVFLFLIYWTERLHYFFYDIEPLFVSVPDFLFWITVLVGSGLEQGTKPKSLFGIVLAGVFPFFLAGTVFTIIRYTSEAAHESLVEQMARGQITSNRIIVMNYQEKYDRFIRNLLDQTDAFVTLFAKETHLQDAEGLRDSFETTSQEGYRLFVTELSYSTEVLLDTYQILDAREIFVFPDMEEETEYHNLQLITTLNNTIKKREQYASDSVDCPNVVWHSNKVTVSDVGHQLSSSTFSKRLHTMSFGDDLKRLIDVNTWHTVQRLDEYFGFAGSADRPEWIEGYRLEGYEFTSTDLGADERAALEDLRRARRDGASFDDTLGSQKRELICDIEARLDEDLPEGDPSAIGPLYGLVVDVAGSTVPIDLYTAYSSQQIETAQQSLQITKSRGPDTAEGETRSREAAGDIYVINYNENLRQFLSAADGQVERGDRTVTVFCSDDQITPETSTAVEFVTYDTTTDLVDGLFDPEAPPVDHTVSPGDSVLLFLDYAASKPQIDVLKKLDAVDRKLDAEARSISHNDIFLAVESSTNIRSELYSYLSVDKVIESFRVQEQFLHNFVRLRSSSAVRSLVYEGKIDSQEAFAWAVETARYFREFQIEPASEIYVSEAGTRSIVGENHYEAISEVRTLDERSPQLFASFEVHPDTSSAYPTVELHELTRDREITDDEFLLLINAI